MEDDVVARARQLAPKLAERAKAANELRRVPEETIADLQAAGLFRLLQPSRWGGAEAEPGVFFDVQTGARRRVPVDGVGVRRRGRAQLAARALPARGARGGLGRGRDDADLVVVRADGQGRARRGRLSHLGALVVLERLRPLSVGLLGRAGAARSGEAGRAAGDADVPRAARATTASTTPGTWPGCARPAPRTSSSRARSIPEHRTHRLIDGYRRSSPGNEVNPAPLYRLPFGQIFVRSVSTSAIGAAQGALDVYTGIAAKRVAAGDGQKVAEDPASQLVAAQASELIDEARVILHRNFDEMMASVRADRDLPLERRLRFRYDSSQAVVKSVGGGRPLFTASGGRAIFLDSPMQRYFQDVHAARAHYANNPDKPGRNWGGVQLGLKNTDYFV